jgi:hypothetical protein
MRAPANPKIYHIVHVDRLPSIVAEGCLWSDAEIARRSLGGTSIGMSAIKQRRLNELSMDKYPDLYIGECVPFYFCPRSIMLYLIHTGNHEGLSYRGGQGDIVHLEADLRECVAWAETQGKRWAFTLSNAGAYYCESRYDLAHLSDIDWAAVNASSWSKCKEGKQAEFLVEQQFPWELVSRIGVHSQKVHRQVLEILSATRHNLIVELKPEWYY